MEARPTFSKSVLYKVKYLKVLQSCSFRVLLYKYSFVAAYNTNIDT